tara:strand:- start:330 stop:542 length:213 start_codon:yes stop_codon:yes gene_type:complete
LKIATDIPEVSAVLTSIKFSAFGIDLGEILENLGSKLSAASFEKYSTIDIRATVILLVPFLQQNLIKISR